MRLLVSIVVLMLLTASAYADGVQQKFKHEYLATIKCPAQPVFVFNVKNDTNPSVVYKKDVSLRLYKSSLHGFIDEESKEQTYTIMTDPKESIPSSSYDLLTKLYATELTEEKQMSVVDLSSLLITHNIRYMDLRFRPSSSQTTDGESDLEVEVLKGYLLSNCAVIYGL